MHLTKALRIRTGDVVALTGAGGKTSTMFRLADELVAVGKRVITTTTTHIFTGQAVRAPVCLCLSDGETGLGGLSRALDQHGHVLVVDCHIPEKPKSKGLPAALIDRVAAETDADVVVVEADGARERPFKAPAAHEPVIPASATIVVPVVGMNILGQPMDDDHVHRPSLVAELTGATEGDPITPALIATVLAHPDGGAKGIPPHARLVPFLNKVETPAKLAAAREIARRLLAAPRVDSVLIGATQADEPVQEVWTRIDAVVLAAGAAKRFGALKQVAPWRGRPLVAHVTAQALACPDLNRVAVTVGAQADQVAAALQGQDVTIVPVPDWRLGQSRSVLAGLNSLLAAEGAGQPGAVLFLLADQPGAPPGLLTALIQRHRETLAPVIAPHFRGQRGNPVLFDRATFPEFAGLAGDIGARPILQAHRDEIVWLDWPSPEILQDIDTRADYEDQQG